MNPNNIYPSGSSAPQQMPPAGQPQGAFIPPNGDPNKILPGNPKPIGWIVTVAVLVVFLIGFAVFAFWANGQRQDYKSNSDQKVAAAVKVAERTTTEKNNKEFTEELKNPLKKYVGPEALGSVSITYPKTWSGYVDTSATSGSLLNAYFNPDIVPSLNVPAGSTTRQAVALHVEVVNQTYDQVVTQLKGQVTAGKLSAQAYTLPKMPEQIGTKFVGTLPNQLQGTEIVIPLRDKTLIITTESDNYLADFETYIVPNLSFVP